MTINLWGSPVLSVPNQATATDARSSRSSCRTDRLDVGQEGDGMRERSTAANHRLVPARGEQRLKPRASTNNVGRSDDDNSKLDLLFAGDWWPDGNASFFYCLVLALRLRNTLARSGILSSRVGRASSSTCTCDIHSPLYRR